MTGSLVLVMSTADPTQLMELAKCNEQSGWEQSWPDKSALVTKSYQWEEWLLLASGRGAL